MRRYTIALLIILLTGNYAHAQFAKKMPFILPEN